MGTEQPPLLISISAFYLNHCTNIVARMAFPASELASHDWLQQRIAVSLQREDGKTLHIRKSTRAEPHQKVIYAVSLKIP